MKIFDEVLNKEEKIHEEVSPKVEVGIDLKEPESFARLFAISKIEEKEEE